MMRLEKLRGQDVRSSVDGMKKRGGGVGGVGMLFKEGDDAVGYRSSDRVGRVLTGVYPCQRCS